MSENPFDVLRKEMKPLGASLETGTCVAVTSPTISVNIGGSVVPDIPVAGSMPSVGGKVWLIRQGTTVVAIAVGGGGGTFGLGKGNWHPYQSGKYYPGWRMPQGTTQANVTLPTGTTHPQLIVVSRPVTISHICSPNYTSFSADLKWAIYDSDEGGYPKGLLDSGEVTETVTRSMDIPLSANLTLSGVYWVMWKANGTSYVRGNSQLATTPYYWNSIAHSNDLAATTGSGAVDTPLDSTWYIGYWNGSVYNNDWPDPWSPTGAWGILSSSYSSAPAVFKVA